MAECKEIFWTNPKSGEEKKLPFNMEDTCDAEARLRRFDPYIAKAFPETAASGGIIESELVEIPNMKKELEKMKNFLQFLFSYDKPGIWKNYLIYCREEKT